MSCIKCGAQLPEGATFCPNCGQSQVVVSSVGSTAEQPTRRKFSTRVFHAMKLKSDLFEEVEHDQAASRQVLFLILGVSVASGIGQGLTSLIVRKNLGSIAVDIGIGFALTIIGLAIWSYLVYLVGTRLFRGVATPAETWRCAGFAYSPGLFYFIPFVGPIFSIWIIVSQVIAARQALDITTGKAVVTCVISIIPYLILIGVITLVLRAVT